MSYIDSSGTLEKVFRGEAKKDIIIRDSTTPLSNTQYAHNVVLTSIRRRFNVMDVVWTSKRRRLLTGNGR